MKEFEKIFKNEEFENKMKSLKINISDYLKEKDYNLGSLKIDELIHSNDTKNGKIIHPSEKCPNDIKNIVTDFIKEKFQ